MENPEKISLQFELLNTYYSKIACKMSHTPIFSSSPLLRGTKALRQLFFLLFVLLRSR